MFVFGIHIEIQRAALAVSRQFLKAILLSLY